MELLDFCKYYEYLMSFSEITLELEHENKMYIKFDKENFYHLAGLHKLCDIKYMFEGKRKRRALSVCKKEIMQIKKSKYYEDVKQRVYFFNLILWAILNGEFISPPNRKILNSSIISDFYCCYKISRKDGKIRYFNIHFVVVDGKYLKPSSLYISGGKRYVGTVGYRKRKKIVFNY